LRLQGFPDSYKIVCTDEQTRKQTGNALPIPVAKAVIAPIIKKLAIPTKKNDDALNDAPDQECQLA
jgi:DNA (cytosine-5)-methyltransferase 1